MKFEDYIKNRYKDNPEAEKALWEGYEEFKIGYLLKEARMISGMTQEQIAIKLKTTKSVISRIENHSQDIRISTLEKFAKAIGKNLHISIS